MFGASNLKSEIVVTEISVECPVKACKKTVPRQRGTFQRSEKFLCPEHDIYISPSTFEYDKPTDNLLWKNEVDLAPVKKNFRS